MPMRFGFFFVKEEKLAFFERKKTETFSLQFTHSKHFKDIILMKRKESPRTTRSVSSSSEEEEENDHANEKDATRTTTTNDGFEYSTKKK